MKALMKEALQTLREAGSVLRRHFGKVRNVRQKENLSSVVCEADLASERLILDWVRARYPEDSIIAEESGFSRGRSGATWVVDPLDGTSNFVAGLPWFGVQFGLLRDSKPVFTAMYLPVDDTLYWAAKGEGVFKNGRRLQPPPPARLKQVLCAFGFDAAASPVDRRRHADLLVRVASGVRNTRATNSLVDFCFTLEGRFGACVNLNCKVWDIVPITLMLPEMGGVLTDLRGRPIRFDLHESIVEKSYQVLGAAKPVHREILRLIRHA